MTTNTLTKVQKCKAYRLLSQKIHGINIDNIKSVNESGIIFYEHPIRSQVLVTWNQLGYNSPQF